MRIAFFGKSKRHTRTTSYIARALEREGHAVRWLNQRRLARLLGRRAAHRLTLSRLARFRPELVLIHANDVLPETLEAVVPGQPTALFTPDCWSLPLERETLALARRVDLLLTVAPGQIPDFLAAGVRRAEFLAEACDQDAHHPVARPRDAFASDVAFIGKTEAGSPRVAARAALVAKVAGRFDTAVYGRGWEPLGISPRRRDVYPREYREICSAAKIVLGRDWTTACAGYTSNRTWFTLGCGGFLITSHSPGLEALVANHRHLVWYASDDECLELIEHYLARPDQRRRIAEAGRAYALAHRTYRHFARDLIAHVESKQPAFPPAAPERA
jgi:Glycosyl transferases group 1